MPNMTLIKKKTVLLVASETIYPARENGLSIRYAPMIEALSDEIDIDVAVILREGVPFEGIDDLKKLCRNVYHYERKVEPTPRITKALARIEKCLQLGTPYTHHCYDAPKLKSFLTSISTSHNYDSVVWISSAYLDIGIEIFGAKNIVVDSIDSVYSQFSRKQTRGIFDYLDRKHLKSWEQKFIEHVKATIFVSEVDANLYSDCLHAKDKVYVIPNGVYLSDFSSSQSPQVDAEERPACLPIRLGFLGNMGYEPNIDAVLRLKRIYDNVKKTRPDIQLVIIGRTPSAEVLSLGTSDGVTVTGTVDNIWPHVHSVDIFVFPMISGAGQQNKLLEAMAAAKPIVANRLANSGVRALPDRDLLICESDDDFYNAIIKLADDQELRRRIGLAGRSFIHEAYDWDAILPKMKTLWFANS